MPQILLIIRQNRLILNEHETGSQAAMLRNSGQAAGNAYSESADERELFFLGLPGRGLSASKAPYMPDAEGSPSASLLFARGLSAPLGAKALGLLE